MKKLFLILAMVLLLPVLCFSADLNLKWEASQGATGYKLYMSTDMGTTWQAPQDVGNVLTYTYVGVPDNVLVLFRVSAYNAVGEIITTDRGAWYDGRKTLPKVTYNLGVF